ncbi:MAG: hypothetical protein IKB88_01670 [Clostridia bacterium]|nr:hypothetical protein [Clostridia bacterium]
MNNYIKPVIKLATVDASGNVVSCGTTEEDMNLILDLVGANKDTAFGLNEQCDFKVPLDMYCKFTSAQLGKVLVFWS